MNVLRRIGALLLVALVITGAAAGQAGADTPPSVRRVVIISVPRLGWDDVDGTRTPVLAKLATEGGVASLSTRSFGRFTDRAEGYATLGAGARATAETGYASSGFGFGERVLGAGGNTSGLSLGPDGTTVPRTAIVVPGIDDIRSRNSGEHQGAVPGALGSALNQAQRTTQVIANHDSANGVDRLAALGVMNELGVVGGGRVFVDLTTAPKSTTPSSNAAALVQAARALPTENNVALIEIGDIDWADLGDDAAARTAAVARADLVLGQLLDTIDLSKDVVFVISPVSPRSQEQPTPFIVAGPGIVPGWATSATTHRSGYVTLPDVAPSVLERLGLPVPSSMSGTAISVKGGSPAFDRVGAAQRAVVETRFVDRAAGRLLVTIPIVFACWSLLALLVFCSDGASPVARLGRPLVRWAALVQLAVPVITYLSGLFTLHSVGQPAWHLTVWTLAALGAAILSLRPGVARAPVLLVAGTWLVLILDLLTGGRLAFDTALGNSPTVAGRFTGLGNVGFGLLAGCSLILAVALHAALAAGEFRQRTALAAAGAIFGIAILADGLPGLGSDLGGVLTLVPTAVVTLALLWPRRVRLARAVIAGVGATVAVAAGAIALDLSRPDDKQTHLGRAADRAFGGGGIGDAILRKGAAATDSIVRSSLVWVVICSVLLVVLLHVLGREALDRRTSNRSSRALWWGTITACVLGALVNDSGVMVPAMILLVVMPSTVYVVLGQQAATAAVPPDADDSPGLPSSAESAPASAQ